MERIHYRISLDMFDTVSQKTIKSKRGDTACDVNITLTENGKVYKIADGCYATFSAKKPDGNFILNRETCYIKDNTIVYEFTEQTTICEGIVDCEVILYGADGNQLTSPRFSLLVGGTVYNGEEIISSTEADALKETVEIAERFKDVKTADFTPSGGMEKAVEFANQAYEAYGYRDANGNYIQFSEDSVLYQPIADYHIPMGMTIGDENGPKNVLVDSGISVESLNPTMKLIASGTTTEAVDAIDVTDTTGGEIVDDMGNPAKRTFNLKTHICVRVSVPAVTTKANLLLMVNGGSYIGQIVSSTSTTEKIMSRFEAYYTGGGNWAYTGVAASNGSAVGNAWTCVGYTGQGEGIYHIRLHLASGKLPVGTTYQVYGMEV